MTTRRLRISEIRDEAVGIKSFVLVDPEGAPLPSFTCGAHLDIHLPNGKARQYSLFGRPSERNAYRIAVKREPQSRGGSSGMHELLKPGDLVEVAGPRNNFALAGEAAHVVLLAGGIGITPILSMARHLEAEGASYELHYFVRSREHAAFLDIIDAELAPQKANTLVDLAPQDVERHLMRVLGAPVADTHVHACGPAPFMDAAGAVAGRSLAADAIHFEHFGAPRGESSGEGNDAFEVVLANAGVTVRVEADTTIIAALEQAGINVDFTCEQGVCGTCLTQVLEGEPDHRDLFLTDEEKARNDAMCLCVSRAKSGRLVLAL